MATGTRRWLRRLGPSLAGLAILAACSTGAQPVAAPTSDPATLPESVAATLSAPRLPLFFEPNRGQAGPAVAFLARGPGYQLSLTHNQAILALAAPGGAEQDANSQILRMTFAGARPRTAVLGIEPLPGRSNYLAGGERAEPVVGVPQYARVRYGDLYPGIDLEFYGGTGRLEYDLILAPGADPAAIRLRFAGAQRLRVDADGNLAIGLADQEIVQRAPVIYQESDGVRQSVAGGYVLDGPHGVRFRLGAYDRSRPLVIDPVLVFSTYLSGDGADMGRAIAIDNDRNIYVAGRVFSTKDFPITEGSYLDEHRPGESRFQFVVTKLAADGRSVVYSTYFPVGIDDITVASVGFVYAAGRGCEFNFDPNAPRDLSKCGFYVARLNTAGTALTSWKILVGPGLSDGSNQVTDITLGQLGDPFITGTIVTGELPTTPGVIQPARGGSSDAFVARFDDRGSGLSVAFATYFGGSDGDGASGIDLASDGTLFSEFIYVSGWTRSRDFPVTADAYQTTLGGRSDAFVARITTDGKRIVYATYLGGVEREFMGTEFRGLGSIAADVAGTVYVAGSTESTDFPPARENCLELGSKPTGFSRNQDAFIVRISRDGGVMLFCTRLGGSGNESDLHIAADPDNILYVLGNTRSTDFPLKNPLQSTYAGGSQVNGDLFVARFKTFPSALEFSSYLGGLGADDGNDLTWDVDGNMYITGTTSGDFPLANALQATPGGSESYFVAKISTQAAPAAAGTSRFSSLRVGRSRHDSTLGHNIANVEVTRAGQQNRIARFDAEVESANFLDFYDRTGSLERWGLATSEIFEESPGTLTQYYQRGIVDWKPAPGGGPASLQRRLAWDFIGGGLGGSEDQGVEPGLLNPNPGDELGPWGHKVSDLAVDGIQTLFKFFFDGLGGKDSFGFPKTDARPDTHPDAVLHRPGRPKDDRIRQYFQAAVLEYHPESSQLVKIGLIGDTVRDQKYPNNAWEELLAFQWAGRLTAGADLPRG